MPTTTLDDEQRLVDQRFVFCPDSSPIGPSSSVTQQCVPHKSRGWLYICACACLLG